MYRPKFSGVGMLPLGILIFIEKNIFKTSMSPTICILSLKVGSDSGDPWIVLTWIDRNFSSSVFIFYPGKNTVVEKKSNSYKIIPKLLQDLARECINIAKLLQNFCKSCFFAKFLQEMSICCKIVARILQDLLSNSPILQDMYFLQDFCKSCIDCKNFARFLQKLFFCELGYGWKYDIENERYGCDNWLLATWW